MLVCGDCGEEIHPIKCGIRIFSVDLKKTRFSDVYLCDICQHTIITEHGANWRDTHIEEIDLSDYNIKLTYDHYTALQNRPVCFDCRKIMDFMGEGIYLLKDEHSYQKGKIWGCPNCDYIFIFFQQKGWGAPLTNDEKHKLEEEFAPNIIKEKVGVIPFFQTIHAAE